MPLKPDGIMVALFMCSVLGTTVVMHTCTPALALNLRRHLDEDRCRQVLRGVRERNKIRERRAKARPRGQRQYQLECRMSDGEYLGWT